MNPHDELRRHLTRREMLHTAGRGIGGAALASLLLRDGFSAEANKASRPKAAVGEVSANVHGTSMIPALIIPLPLIARTETAACKGLASELQRFITDSGPTT